MKLLHCALRPAFRSTLLFVVCGIIILSLVSGVFGFQPGTPGTQPTYTQPASQTDLGRIIDSLTLWVTTLAIFVTVVIAASALNIFNQYYQARKFGENIKNDLMTTMEQEINKLQEKYNLIALKTPDKILEDARRDYDPLIENLRRAIETQYSELSSKMTTADSDLRVFGESNLRAISELRAEIAQMPTIDTLLQEVTARYRLPSDLQESLLRKVLDAFLQLENLTKEERQAISKSLIVNQETTNIS